MKSIKQQYDYSKNRERTEEMNNKRLILTDATLDDRSEEFAAAICEAQEFEWYYGIKETPEIYSEIKINRKGYYNIFDKKQRFIGYVGIHYEDEEPEIELYILKKFRRKGLAKETLTTILSHVFYEGIGGKKLTKVIASVRSENTNAIKLMEHCGFKRNTAVAFCMKVFFCEEKDDPIGEVLDVVDYFITREMFEEIYGKEKLK